MINPARQGIFDIVASVADVDNYWFLGSAGIASTISGLLLDTNAVRAKNVAGARSVAFTFTIPAGNGTNNPVSFATILGLSGSVTGNYPNAQGIVANISNAVCLDLQDSGVADADFKANFANYPIINPGNSQKFSRVS